MCSGYKACIPCALQTFFPQSLLSFHSHSSAFWRAEVLTFDGLWFISFPFQHIFWCHISFSRSFSVLDVAVRCMIYFELNFVKGGECRCFLPSLPLSLHIHEAEAAQSCPTLCNPGNCSPLGSSIVGFSRQEYWSGLPFPNCLRTAETILWKILSQQTSSGPSARIVWGPSPSQQLFSSSSEIIRMSKSPTCEP